MKKILGSIGVAVVVIATTYFFRTGFSHITKTHRQTLKARIQNYKLKSKLIVTRNLFERFVEHDMEYVMASKDANERYRYLSYFTANLMLKYSQILGVTLDKEMENYANQVLKGMDSFGGTALLNRKMREAQKLAREQRKFLNQVDESIDYPLLESTLSKFTISNPIKYLQECKNVYTANTKIQNILGRFSGEMFYLVGKEQSRIDEVFIDADYEIIDGHLTGELTVSLAHKGEVYSRMRESGESIIKEHAEHLNDIVIEAGPDMFFQLYYVPNSDFFIGNYYEEGVRKAIVKIFPR